MKKGRAGNKIYDILTIEEFDKDPESVLNNKEVAVHYGDYIYPVLNKFENGPGIYSNDKITAFGSPMTEEEKINYSANNIIDFSKAKDMKEIIQSSNNLKEIEKSLLISDSDNIYIPTITNEDTEEMRILKEAIGEKQIELNKYKDRIPGYNNNIRILTQNNISFDKFKMFMDSFDLKATLVIEDKSTNVANPMNKKLEIQLNNPEI